MSGYVLSILGIVLVGVVLDIIIPSGSINKYIKSVYGIFVLAVIFTPIVKLLSNISDYSINYTDYEMSETLLNYISNKKIESMEDEIISRLEASGLNNIDIKINYSLENNELSINSCTVNLKNVVIDADKSHINKYDYIIEVVHEITNLSEEVILFYE